MSQPITPTPVNMPLVVETARDKRLRERAYQIGIQTLAEYQTEPYGDLRLNAARASAKVVTALMEAGLLSFAAPTDEELHASFLASEQWKETPTERLARQLAEQADPVIDPDCWDGKHGSCVGDPCQCPCHEDEPKAGAR